MWVSDAVWLSECLCLSKVVEPSKVVWVSDAVWLSECLCRRKVVEPSEVRLCG